MQLPNPQAEIGSGCAVLPVNGAPPEQKTAREAWVDVARGIGIILVVYGHVMRGHFLSNPPRWVTIQDEVLYSFHMPLFFVLSGMFLWSSLGRERFLQSRWSQLIYPYLLWSIVTVTLEILLSPYVNSPLSVRDALLIPFVPIEQYWFLYALLVCQLVAFFAFPRKWLLVPLGLLGLLILATLGGGWIVVRAFIFFPFVILGVFLRDAFIHLSHATQGRQLLVATLSWLAFAILYVSGMKGASVLLGIAGSIGTAALAMLGPRSTILIGLGKASLTIYLLHSMFSAGARIALGKIGVAPSSLISVATAVIVGIAIPYFIWGWAKRTDRMALLGFGAK